MATETIGSNENESHDLPPPARAKPSSIAWRNRGSARGVNRSGSTPSQISPASRSMESEPLPRTIGMGWSWCRIDCSGLPSPVEPSPV